tara:strand:+ start:1015 stop:1425 length:411 start_codon:yes stop_codon:yes gene_type:complete
MADSSKDAQKYWWIKNKQIGIGWLDDVKNSDDGLYYALAGVTRIKTVTVSYKAKLDKISDLSTTLTNKLPSQFDDALISRAIGKGYELVQDPEALQLVVFWDQKFELQLKRIQEWSNTDLSKTPKIIKSVYPYAVK